MILAQTQTSDRKIVLDMSAPGQTRLDTLFLLVVVYRSLFCFGATLVSGSAELSVSSK